MKHLSYLLACMGLCLWCSCSDDEQTPPQPEPTDEYTLTLKSSETVAFETFAAGSESAQAATGTEAEWFGKRTQLAGASTLYFHDGQVDMTKPGGLKESYDMKWEGDELLLHDGANDSWTRTWWSPACPARESDRWPLRDRPTAHPRPTSCAEQPARTGS